MTEGSRTMVARDKAGSLHEFRGCVSRSIDQSDAPGMALIPLTFGPVKP